jgi:hypothetical protein
MGGRQRLAALREFRADEFALAGLECWPELNGRRHSELPLMIRDGTDRRYISSIILLKETAVDEAQAAKRKKMVFERLNSGGAELSHQEARNAVCGGPLNGLCLKLSENKTFRQMWRIPSDPKPAEDNKEKAYESSYESAQSGARMFEKMEDVELVPRFLACRKIEHFNPGLNKITELLDRFIAEGNKFKEHELTRHRSMFENTVDFLWQILGKDAFTTLGSFKKRPAGSSMKRPAKIVCDPMMFAASSPKVTPHCKILMAEEELLGKNLRTMHAKNKTLFSGHSANKKSTHGRDTVMKETFMSVIAKTRE